MPKMSMFLLSMGGQQSENLNEKESSSQSQLNWMSEKKNIINEPFVDRNRIEFLSVNIKFGLKKPLMDDLNKKKGATVLIKTKKHF